MKINLIHKKEEWWVYAGRWACIIFDLGVVVLIIWLILKAI